MSTILVNYLKHWSDGVTREDGEWVQLPFIKS
jgi:hypothetical protein